jgi:hypothetical protein
MNVILWIVQVLLALLFIFAGAFKLIVPVSALMAQAPPGQIVLPGLLLKFIGLCELLGGFGLILPGVFKRRQGLIPLAALGLLIIMIGAVVITMSVVPKDGVFPLITGLLLAFVAYGRWRLRPLG